MLTFAGTAAQFAYKRRKLHRQSWHSILSRAEAVNLTALQEISDVYLHPGADQLRIEPNEMWKAVGGLSGLQHMRQNATTMLELAVFAERWNTENGRIVSELIRRDVSRFRKAALRVELSFLHQFGFIRAPFHLQEAISSYWLMRGRLLGAYSVAHIGLKSQLEAVL